MDFGEIILDLLSSATWGETSINMLSKQLKKNGFSGDYKNTYQKIMKFEKEKLIITTRIGKSKTISLNYQKIDTLSRVWPNITKKILRSRKKKKEELQKQERKIIFMVNIIMKKQKEK